MVNNEKYWSDMAKGLPAIQHAMKGTCGHDPLNVLSASNQLVESIINNDTDLAADSIKTMHESSCIMCQGIFITNFASIMNNVVVSVEENHPQVRATVETELNNFCRWADLIDRT